MERHRRRGLVRHRRHGLARPQRLRAHRRAQQGRDHPGRREHSGRRDRGAALPAPGGGDGGHRRLSGRAARRARVRGGGAAPGAVDRLAGDHRFPGVAQGRTTILARTDRSARHAADDAHG